LARRPDDIFVAPFERGEIGSDLFRQASQPQAWPNVNKGINGSLKSFQDLVALEVAAIGKAKLPAEAQSVAARMTRTTADSWRDMALNTKSVAGDIRTRRHNS
jgi:hypothetical protein